MTQYCLSCFFVCGILFVRRKILFKFSFNFQIKSRKNKYILLNRHLYRQIRTNFDLHNRDAADLKASRILTIASGFITVLATFCLLNGSVMSKSIKKYRITARNDSRQLHLQHSLDLFLGKKFCARNHHQGSVHHYRHCLVVVSSVTFPNEQR